MIKRGVNTYNSENRWLTVAELSLRGEVGCEHKASEKVAEILVGIHIPDRVIMEAIQAVAKVMEKEMLNIETDQAQQAFTIIVQTQLAQSLEIPAAEAISGDTHPSSRGWSFFLTEKRITDTMSGLPMCQLLINVHLYHEGRQT